MLGQAILHLLLIILFFHFLLLHPHKVAGSAGLAAPAAVLEIKKLVARYCLLSWTMCLCTFSRALRCLLLLLLLLTLLLHTSLQCQEHN